jgi:hypothetical protein
MSVSRLFSLSLRRATAVARRLPPGSGPVSAPPGEGVRAGAANGPDPRAPPTASGTCGAGVAYLHCGAHRNRERPRKGILAGPDWRAQTGGPRLAGHTGGVVTIDEVRALASRLPRSYEAVVADRVKFRVGRIVYLAFSRDERIMGFGFPKEERELLVSSEPAKFQMPSKSDMRYNWAHVRLEAIDDEEMRELVLDAWQMVVPKKVAAEYFGLHGRAPGGGRK